MNLALDGFVVTGNAVRCRLRRKSWKNPGRIYADNSAALDEGFGNPICSDLMFEVLDGMYAALQLKYYSAIKTCCVCVSGYVCMCVWITQCACDDCSLQYKRPTV